MICDTSLMADPLADDLKRLHDYLAEMEAIEVNSDDYARGRERMARARP
jgi:hypothetical protein